MISGWRYGYRRYLGWLPVQFCMTCGKWYRGGFPRPGWQASWMEYCSKECCDAEVFW